MWPKNDIDIGHLLPLQYWISVQAIWYTLKSKYIEEHELNRNISILLDGWYYKFLAKCKVDKTLDIRNVEYYFEHIIKPDIVILTIIDDFEKYWELQTNLKPSKLGVHQGFSSRDKVAFMQYQFTIQENLVKYGKKNNWIILHSNELEKVNDSEYVINILSNLL